VISRSRLDDQSATDNLCALVYVCSVVPGLIFAARKFASSLPGMEAPRLRHAFRLDREERQRLLDFYPICNYLAHSRNP